MESRHPSRAFALALLACLAAAPAARALTLREVLDEVAARNPMLAMRREMAAAARERIAPAGAWSAPMLELGALNVPPGGRFDMDPMTMRMVGLQQALPVSGANGLRRRAAESGWAAARANAEDAHWEALGMAWGTYADAYWADVRVAMATSHQDEMDQMLAAAKARYASGGGRLEDVLRAEAERAATLAEAAGLEAEARDAHARLAAVMGRDPGGAPDTLAAPPDVTLPATAAEWTADAPHPRLRALQAEADRDAISARAMRRMAWPDLQLGVSYGMRGTIMDQKLDDMWSATVGLMLPVFAGSRERAQGAEMDAMARARGDERRAAALDLAQRVTSLHARALAGRRTVALLADTVVVAQSRALEATRASYRAGTADLGRVLDAMHVLYAQELALTRSRAELAHTEGELLTVTARGDRFGAPAPVATEVAR